MSDQPKGEDAEFVIGARVRDLRVPPVPSSRHRCALGCGAWVWLSDKTKGAMPAGMKVICLYCGDAMAKARGGNIDPVIPDVVREEFIQWVEARQNRGNN